MYTHILIPTDGSELANKAVLAGLEFARFSKARVTGFTAMPEYQPPTTSEILAHRKGVSIDEHERRSKQRAEEILAPLAERARAAGVEFGSDFALSNQPWQAIVAAAQKHRCDLIFIASHGRRGLSEFIHGSQTREVLTHSTIPTLVYR